MSESGIKQGRVNAIGVQDGLAADHAPNLSRNAVAID